MNEDIRGPVFRPNECIAVIPPQIRDPPFSLFRYLSWHILKADHALCVTPNSNSRYAKASHVFRRRNG
jgi:hypothetical protein